MRKSSFGRSSSDASDHAKTLNGDVDVHDFITANYGSALRNATETALHSVAEPGKSSLRSLGLAVMFARHSGATVSACMRQGPAHARLKRAAPQRARHLASKAQPAQWLRRALSRASQDDDGSALPLALEPPFVDETQRLLEHAIGPGSEAWEFDAPALQRSTNDHALLFAGYHFFKREGLIEQFGIRESVRRRIVPFVVRPSPCWA